MATPAGRGKWTGRANGAGAMAKAVREASAGRGAAATVVVAAAAAIAAVTAGWEVWSGAGEGAGAMAVVVAGDRHTGDGGSGSPSVELRKVPCVELVIAAPYAVPCLQPSMGARRRVCSRRGGRAHGGGQNCSGR